MKVKYRIWKYELLVNDTQSVDMPVNAEILSVDSQRGTLFLWAMVDADEMKEKRVFEVIGTGNPVPQGMGTERRFIGTVLMGPFAWHVFERTGGIR